MIIRSFLPVGQGAFFCEQFYNRCDGERINVVYDCGSSSDIEILKHQIMNCFNPEEVIHALFISHLHDDHINGIPFLLQHYDVKNIFFPLITEENRFFVELYNWVNFGKNSFAAAFISDPNNAIKSLDGTSRTKLYRIKEVDTYDDSDYSNLDSYSQDGIGYISSGENVVDYIVGNRSSKNEKYFKWQFIPYNFRQTSRLDQLLNAINKTMGCNHIDNNEIKNIWQNGTDDQRNAIKQAYREVKGSMNTNSMTLYSGVDGFAHGQFILENNYYPRTYCKKCVVKNVGCLYMGDYDASGDDKWENIRNKYNDYWNSIGCIQIPHHGSRHNYNDKISNINAFHIIAAGQKNKYHHPHSNVIKSLLHNKRYPYIVTEDENSKIQFKISI